MTTAIRPEVAVRGRDVLGECPVWLAEEKRIMWVDGSGRRIHWLDPRSGAVERMDLDREVGSVAPASDGRIVAALLHDFVVIDRARAVSVVASVESGVAGNRMNDGKCDSRGRFWAGSWTLDLTPAASLYRLNTDFSVEVVLAPVTCSNGLGWSPDDRVMYYIDSTTYRVDAFDYEPDSGEIRRRPPLVEIPEPEGMPDGLTVDADGCVWVCLWGGSAVRRYDPKGRLDMVLELPTVNVTSCTFGGEDLHDLYITTAREDLDEQALASQPEAGSLFVCRPGPAGLRPNAFAGVP